MLDGQVLLWSVGHQLVGRKLSGLFPSPWEEDQIQNVRCLECYKNRALWDAGSWGAVT
jgi:hypothetical protein